MISVRICPLIFQTLSKRVTSSLQRKTFPWVSSHTSHITSLLGRELFLLLLTSVFPSSLKKWVCTERWCRWRLILLSLNSRVRVLLPVFCPWWDFTLFWRQRWRYVCVTLISYTAYASSQMPHLVFVASFFLLSPSICCCCLFVSSLKLSVGANKSNLSDVFGWITE